MSTTDYPTTAQATRLSEDFRNPVISHLIWWGMEKIHNGEMMGLTGSLWTRGAFSRFIDQALVDKLMAEKDIIHAMAQDFIRVTHLANDN